MSRTLRDRLVQAYFRLRRPMTLGVRVLIRDEAGRVCLIRHTYAPGWALPGGGVERGERALEAAIKEAREEAHVEIAAGDLRLASVHANFRTFPGDHVLVYHADRFEPVPEAARHDNALEIAQIGFFAPDALPEGTTPGTRRRLAEAAGAPLDPDW